MDLAICISLKNRSYVNVEPEDPIETYKHIAKKIIDTPIPIDFEPNVFHDGSINLRLLPRMLISLISIKKPTDKWTLIIVDYNSTDVNVERLCAGICSDVLPYVVHTVKGYTFSRGTGLDTAAKIAKERGHTSLFFCDSDMYFTERYIFDKAAEVLEEKKIFYPICFSFTLPNHQRGYWRDTGYGMVFMNTETYFNSSRWKHNVSWGWEDNELHASMNKNKIVRIPCNGYFHQWHPNSIYFKTQEYPIKHFVGKHAIVDTSVN